jgi:hypothetical protein
MSNPVGFFNRVGEVNARYRAKGYVLAVITAGPENIRDAVSRGYKFGSDLKAVVSKEDLAYLGVGPEGEYMDALLAIIPLQKSEKYEQETRQLMRDNERAAEEQLDEMSERLGLPVVTDMNLLEA